MGKRIAYMVGSLGAGGLERVAWHLATQLMERGHQPCFCCFDLRGDELADETESMGIPVELIIRRDGFDFAFIDKLRRWMRRTNPDVLHMHNSTALFYGTIAASLARVPMTIATEHDGVFPRSKPKQWANRALVRGPLTHAVAVSNEVKKLWCDSDHIAEDMVKVIPNGVPDTSRPRAPHDGVRVGVVGRLSKEKGQDVLIEAFAPIAAERSDVQLVLVGDGPVRGDLEKMIADKQLGDRIEMLGRRSDIPELLATFDIFVQPSRREGLPLAILEAMASRVPIVSSGVGGIPEALGDGTSGRLVPPEDPSALGTALRQLIDDPATRQRLGEAGRRVFEDRYELTKMVDRYEALMFEP